jgi:hypothetical protein
MSLILQTFTRSINISTTNKPNKEWEIRYVSDYVIIRHKVHCIENIRDFLKIFYL